MTKKLRKDIKRAWLRIVFSFLCFSLFVKHLFIIRTLKVQKAELYEKIVIENNEIELLWEARGCHKVIVHGIGMFPGNSFGIRLLFSNRINPIRLTFCGIAKRVNRLIYIPSSKISVPESFDAKLDVPDIRTFNVIDDSLDLSQTITDLDINAPELKILLEPYVNARY